MQNILSPWCLLNLFIPIYSLKPFSTSHPPPSFPSFCLLPSLLSFFISLIFSNTVGKSHLSSILALVWETGDLSLWLDDNTNFWLYMIFSSVQFSSVQFSRSVMSDTLWPHESQHARPPCPSPTPGVHSDSRPSSPWCHPAITSLVIPSPAPNLSQHQSLFQWVNSLHQVSKVLELQL